MPMDKFNLIALICVCVRFFSFDFGARKKDPQKQLKAKPNLAYLNGILRYAIAKMFTMTFSSFDCWP